GLLSCWRRLRSLILMLDVSLKCTAECNKQSEARQHSKPEAPVSRPDCRGTRWAWHTALQEGDPVAPVGQLVEEVRMAPVWMGPLKHASASGVREPFNA